MSDLNVFTDPTEVPTADEELADVDATIEDAEEGLDVATLTTLPPLGRSYARDFARGGFVPYGAGPLQTSGLDTLRYWIEKCLRTARGAHPVYSDAFGVDDPYAEVGEPVDTITRGDILERVEAALTVHPRIDAVSDLTIEGDPDDDYLVVSIIVVVNGPDGGTLTFNNLEVATSA